MYVFILVSSHIWTYPKMKQKGCVETKIFPNVSKMSMLPGGHIYHQMWKTYLKDTYYQLSEPLQLFQDIHPHQSLFRHKMYSNIVWSRICIWLVTWTFFQKSMLLGFCKIEINVKTMHGYCFLVIIYCWMMIYESLRVIDVIYIDNWCLLS